MIVLPTIYEGQTTYDQELEFFDNSTGVDVPIDFTGFVIEMDLVRNDTVFKHFTSALEGIGESDGLLIINENVITVKSYTSTLPPGVYLFDLKCVSPQGRVQTGLGQGVHEILNAKTK